MAAARVKPFALHYVRELLLAEGLSANAKLVGVGLMILFADWRDGTGAHPSYARLADYIHRSKSVTIAGVKELVAAGWLVDETPVITTGPRRGQKATRPGVASTYTCTCPHDARVADATPPLAEKGRSADPSSSEKGRKKGRKVASEGSVSSHHQEGLTGLHSEDSAPDALRAPAAPSSGVPDEVLYPVARALAPARILRTDEAEMPDDEDGLGSAARTTLIVRAAGYELSIAVESTGAVEMVHCLINDPARGDLAAAALEPLRQALRHRPGVRRQRADGGRYEVWLNGDGRPPTGAFLTALADLVPALDALEVQP